MSQSDRAFLPLLEGIGKSNSTSGGNLQYNITSLRLVYDIREWLLLSSPPGLRLREPQSRAIYDGALSRLGYSIGLEVKR